MAAKTMPVGSIALLDIPAPLARHLWHRRPEPSTGFWGQEEAARGILTRAGIEAGR